MRDTVIRQHAVALNGLLCAADREEPAKAVMAFATQRCRHGEREFADIFIALQAAGDEGSLMPPDDTSR
jgi:hypothetical protein